MTEAPNSLAQEKPYPSVEAMRAAVELEIHAALGHVQTVTIGQMIQKAIDAALAVLQPPEGVRGNYEDRHPNDMVLHPLSEIREWDEALQVLGIQDSDQTPADAIRERDAEIERLRSQVELKPVPFCWVIPGGDTARPDGSIDAMAFETGEFTRPLYAALRGGK